MEQTARVTVHAAPNELPAKPLAERYQSIRARSLRLVAPLTPEDAMVQSMPDASPAKWHLAHTTWFFERFLLADRPDYRPVNEDWDFLFNSYYQSIGPMHARPQRGLLSRPTLDEVLDYRQRVDTRVLDRLAAGGFDPAAQQRLLLGLNHEQQHQELLLTDIKHAFFCNPLQPAYRHDLQLHHGVETPLRWIDFESGIVTVGAPRWPEDDGAFAYDNESPRHQVLLAAYALANQPVRNGDYRKFIADGGYRTSTLWLSEGWTRLQNEGWQRPLYWDEDLTREFTLAGWQEADPHAPVCHLSYYEADAYARWAGARLPTEAEWERAAANTGFDMAGGHDDVLHPQAVPATDAAGFIQLSGGVWEWTCSAYTAYPGYQPWSGSIGEYNGKFMCSQWVLRGGSCVSPPGHVRASYRNFFPSDARWQFSGLRLAKDLDN